MQRSLKWPKRSETRHQQNFKEQPIFLLSATIHTGMNNYYSSLVFCREPEKSIEDVWSSISHLRTELRAQRNKVYRTLTIKTNITCHQKPSRTRRERNYNQGILSSSVIADVIDEQREDFLNDPSHSTHGGKRIKNLCQKFRKKYPKPSKKTNSIKTTEYMEFWNCKCYERTQMSGNRSNILEMQKTGYWAENKLQHKQNQNATSASEDNSSHKTSSVSETISSTKKLSVTESHFLTNY